MENESVKLHIKFDGLTLQKGRIDVCDFNDTVSAITDILKFINKNTNYTKDKSIKVELSVLKKGSFRADLIVLLKDLVDIAPAILPLLPDIYTIPPVKQLVDILKSLIKVKLFLGGEKPTKVEVCQDTSPYVAIHNNKGHINVNINTFNLLQSECINRKLQKAVRPLLKENAELETIEIKEEGGESVQIKKEEAPYFEKTEEIQTTTHRVKGVITAFDRKTLNGKISIGEKRVNFETDIKDISNLNKVIDGLIESMKSKLTIIIIGEAVFDLESNLKKIKVEDVEIDTKLLQ